MDVFIGLMGTLGIIACLIWLVVNLIKRKQVKIPVLLLLLSVFAFSIAIAISPPAADEIGSNETVETTEEIADEALSEETESDTEVEEADVSNDQEEPDVSKEETEDSRAPPAGQLKVHFIDVGQGDSIFIETPEQNILIDGGNRGDTVVHYLQALGVRKLDLVVGTHPHADHIGGLINVMENIEVEAIMDPGVVHTTITFEDYLTLIDEKDIKFIEGRAGMQKDLGGGAELKVVHPVSPSSNDLNNASIVARMTYGDVSFLFTGDAEKEAEAEMLNRDYVLQSTVLKAGHHGSRTSTTREFLDAVKPETAVIMCGRDNSYGHPHEETLEQLSGANVDIYRTDLNGTIIVTTDGVSYEVNTEIY